MKGLQLLVLVVFLALGDGREAARAGGPEGPDTRADRTETVCRHYANRARFKPREGEVEFVTLLAEACHAARASLGAGDAAERAAGRLFLDRLVAFHDVIATMNLERMARRQLASGTVASSVWAAVASIPRVSGVGEYLIAREMGLVQALDAWIDTGPDFALALERRGRLR